MKLQLLIASLFASVALVACGDSNTAADESATLNEPAATESVTPAPSATEEVEIAPTEGLMDESTSEEQASTDEPASETAQ